MLSRDHIAIAWGYAADRKRHAAQLVEQREAAVIAQRLTAEMDAEAPELVRRMRESGETDGMCF